MKKKIYYLFFVVFLFVSIVRNVYADDYKVNTLIPVNTIASVETDKFDYKNFVYDPTVDAKGNATMKFEVIQNNTLSKTAISINVLLFDENKKNIGFLTYCTDKDVSSDNAGFKIRANQAVPFTITVTKRYFVEGNFPKDVRYIAVRDENRYCQIGGYDNFKGLTIEEIANGVETEPDSLSFPDFSSYVNMTLIIVLFAIVAVIAMLYGAFKLFGKLKGKDLKIKPVIKKTPKPAKNNTSNENSVNNEVIIDNSEANKPFDLSSLYKDEPEGSSSINIPETKQSENPIADLYNQVEAEPLPEVQKVDESTKAVPIENVYNSINELPEENKTSNETNSSINDLYNSINGTSDSNGDGKISIDDLYESINSDDDDDDDTDDE